MLQASDVCEDFPEKVKRILDTQLLIIVIMYFNDIYLSE